MPSEVQGGGSSSAERHVAYAGANLSYNEDEAEGEEIAIKSWLGDGMSRATVFPRALKHVVGDISSFKSEVHYRHRPLVIFETHGLTSCRQRFLESTTRSRKDRNCFVSEKANTRGHDLGSIWMDFK